MRVRNWDTLLVQWAGLQVGKLFKWGSTDCASLARQACVVMCGEALVPKWRSKVGAVRAIKKAGGPIEMFEKSCTQVGHGFTRTGDVIYSANICTATEYGGLGIVVGDKVLSSNPKEGVTLKPLGLAPECTVWRVNG